MQMNLCKRKKKHNQRNIIGVAKNALQIQFERIT